MRRTAAAAILLGMMTLPVKAIEGPDGLNSRITSHQSYREARQRVKRHKTAKAPSRRKIAQASRRTRVAAGWHHHTATSRFIRGRLVCARNVNAALAARGIRGTGSALAKSFLKWGRPASPVPGAVAVFSRGRGGHVAIVHSVKPNGTVIYLNPSSRRQTWIVGPYRKRPIAYRVAG